MSKNHPLMMLRNNRRLERSRYWSEDQKDTGSNPVGSISGVLLLSDSFMIIISIIIIENIKYSPCVPEHSECTDSAFATNTYPLQLNCRVYLLGK